MAEYVNNVIKGEEQREIHDKRVPEIVDADKGKFLHVNEESGEIEFAEAGGLSVIQFGSFGSGWSSKTVSELYEAVNETDGVYIVSAVQYGTIQGLLVKIRKPNSSFYVSIITTEGENYIGADVSGSTVIGNLQQIKLPPIPFDAGSNTYTLKCVNRTVDWVK